MSERFRAAFFAYPNAPVALGETVLAAVAALNAVRGKLYVQPWALAEIFGVHIPDEVRRRIDQKEVLVADITWPNMNVYYEIGFAIGRGKTVAPVVNTSYADAIASVRRDGIFDNIGYRTYENSEGLRHILSDLPTSNLAELYGKSINFPQPLFVLDTFRKTDFRNAIISAVKGSSVFYRSFDPVETPRFSAVPIIAETTASAGIVVPILGPLIDDAARHNLRAAFLAGLGHGLGRETLIVQKDEGQAQPIDYRDFVLNLRTEEDVTQKVTEFAQSAIIAAQSISLQPPAHAKSNLQRLSLGASAAENEFRTLEEYFVETSEFVRTVRGEVRIIAGRKGSGKTAIFFRARDNFRQLKNCLVTDLKPESHQLGRFREELLKIVDVGAFDHTIVAFWYFVILSELLLTVYKKADFRSKFDDHALAMAREIGVVLDRLDVLGTGDFTSRINKLGSMVIQEVNHLKGKGESLTPERLTNIIYRDGIGQIRHLIDRCTDGDTPMVFLFDNIDKGWPANGVDLFDIRLVRLLTEALDKVRSDFNTEHRSFMSVVFLRNDIYELLVDETPDRGKAAQLSIDWTDRTKLRQVIYRRLQSSTGQSHQSFEQCWTSLFTPTVGTRDSFEYFVDHCLMRPRFLIHIIENAVANAINRGHHVVDSSDCVDAVRQHSSYLIEDFGYEIRDVSGINADILYALIGLTQLLTKGEVLQRFSDYGLPKDEHDSAFRLLLWYGVLGIAADTGYPHFIYDYDYHMKRLEAEIRLAQDDVLYVVNPAFHVALSL